MLFRSHPITLLAGGVLKAPDDEQKERMLKILKEINPEIMKTSELVVKNAPLRLEISDPLTSLWKIDAISLVSDTMSVNGQQVASKEHYLSYDNSKKIMVGPIARVSNNSKLLGAAAEKLAKKAGLIFPLKNIYSNFTCMALEMAEFTNNCIEVLQNTHFEEEAPVKFRPRKGVGRAAVESPKGTIWHEYHISSRGVIRKARIISNVEQNKASLQNMIKSFPLDFDRKTRKELLSEIGFLIDAYYL